MSQLFDGLLTVPPALVLVLVFLLPAAEASTFVGVVFPGEIAVLLGGVLANEQKVPLWAVILLGFAGAVVGDSVGYSVGRRYGHRLLAKLPRRLVRPEHLERAEQSLRQRGGRAVVVGRFTASLRALVPGLAGMSRMPYGRFLAFNVAGAGLWVGVVAVTGYVVGRSYHAAEQRFSLISLGLLLLVVGWLLMSALRRSARGRAWLETLLAFLHRLDAALVRALVALVAAGWLFAGLAQDAVAGDGVVAADPRLLADVLAWRSGWLTPVAKLVSDIGTGPVLYAAVLGAGYLVWRRRGDWRLPVAAVVVLIAGQLLRLALNRSFAVPRPSSALWLVSPSGYAFPSGHTASATIGYALVAWLLASADRSRRWLYLTGAVAVAITVGLSRVYLGVHWPSDVVGGWSFGVAWLGLAAAVGRGLQLAALRRHSEALTAAARSGG